MTQPANAPAEATQPVDVEALHSLVMQSLDDDQAVEVVTIPLAGKSSKLNENTPFAGAISTASTARYRAARRRIWSICFMGSG